MSSLDDEIQAQQAQQAADEMARLNPSRVEHEDGVGYIDTGPVEADRFNPKDFSEVLKFHNLDPEQWRITGHVGFSEWDVPFRNRETDELEFHKAQAHRFIIAERAWGVDLPALYAEVAKTKRRPLKHGTGNASVVVCWADIQTGKVDHLGGLTELLIRLDEKREALKRYLRASKFDHIVVADVGDIVEGFDNFPAQTRTNALSLPDQIDCAATEFWKTIRLCERFAPVDVLSVPSNHGQWRKGKSLIGRPGDDWGIHISKRLEKLNEDRAADGAGLRVKFHRPEDEWSEVLQFEIRGTTLGLAHGHQAQQPDRVKVWWEKMSHSGVLNCDVLVTGHFHFLSLRPHGRDPVTKRSRWHIQCPTLDNGSAWYRNVAGEDGDPALAVFQITENGFDINSFALL